MKKKNQVSYNEILRHKPLSFYTDKDNLIEGEEEKDNAENTQG